MRKVVLLMVLASTAYAKGPKYNFDNPLLVDELVNVYHDIEAVPNGIYKSSSMTLQGITVSSITVNSKATIKGTSTNDDAPAGYIGEYLSSVVGPVSAATSGNFVAATSLALTPGDWDVSLNAQVDPNGGTTTDWRTGISTVLGTSLVQGDNYAIEQKTITALSQLTISNYRISTNTNVTYLANFYAVYTVATPRIYCRFSARRVR